MKLAKNYTYPADVADVFALIRSEEFRTEGCIDQKALDQEVTVEVEDDRHVVTIRRTMPSEMPDFVRKLTGDTVEVVQVETWEPAAADGSRTAAVSVDIVGQPAQMKGTAALTADGGSTSFTVEGNVKVSIPLIGRKIEPEVVKAISASLDAEVALGLKRLGV